MTCQMSHAGEQSGQTTGSRPARLGLGLDPPVVADRLRSALVFDNGDVNKPDTKDFFPDLGSPVSPLRPRGTASTTTNTASSSSSSSGSISDRPPQPSAAASRSDGSTPPARRSHSGELSGDSSPTAVDSRNHLLKPAAHRRSGSGPLIYSGCSGGGSSSSASSPPANVLPAGNICPSGKIGKAGMMPRTTARSDVLGSGTGNYGHGSIMRGGTSNGGGAAASSGMGNLGDSSGRRAMGRTDPQEVTRAGNEHYKKGQYAEALRYYDRAVAMCPDNAACRSNRAAALLGLGLLGEAVRECEEAVRLDPGNVRAHHRLSCLYLR